MPNTFLYRCLRVCRTTHLWLDRVDRTVALRNTLSMVDSWNKRWRFSFASPRQRAPEHRIPAKPTRHVGSHIQLSGIDENKTIIWFTIFVLSPLRTSQWMLPLWLGRWYKFYPEHRHHIAIDLDVISGPTENFANRLYANGIRSISPSPSYLFKWNYRSKINTAKGNCLSQLNRIEWLTNGTFDRVDGKVIPRRVQ